MKYHFVSFQSALCNHHWWFSSLDLKNLQWSNGKCDV